MKPRIHAGRASRPAQNASGASPRQAPEFCARRLQERLAEAGLTRGQLQGEVLRRGLNTHVARLFAGGQPSLKLAWAIADALGCQIEDLLEEAA